MGLFGQSRQEDYIALRHFSIPFPPGRSLSRIRRVPSSPRSYLPHDSQQGKGSPRSENPAFVFSLEKLEHNFLKMPASLPASSQCSQPLHNGPTVSAIPVGTGCATLTQNDAGKSIRPPWKIDFVSRIVLQKHKTVIGVKYARCPCGLPNCFWRLIFLGLRHPYQVRWEVECIA